MKPFKLLMILATTSLIGASSLYANSSYENNDRKLVKKQKHKGGLKSIFKKLNISTEQRASLKIIFKETRNEIQKLRSSIKSERANKHARKSRGDISKFINSNGFNKQGFIKKSTHKSQRMIQLRANKFEKIINILTSEQRLEFAKLLNAKQK